MNFNNNNNNECNTNNTEIQIPNIKKAKISDDDRERIINKALEGYSTKSISDMFQIKYQTVNSIVKKYLKTGQVLKNKRGGDHRSKLTSEIKERLIAKIDNECTLTLKELVRWLDETQNIQVSSSTVDRAIKDFHYTLKEITKIPERRNTISTIDCRESYAIAFRNYEATIDQENLIFLDEVGFNVVSRPKKGRSLSGSSAYLTVPAARSRNISVIAAMNKSGMIYYKINEKAFCGNDFINSMRELKEACDFKGINSPVFIMDNARIHHYNGIASDPVVGNLEIFYLPPYSPFLNPIENVFSVWKNLVIRGGAKNENELRNLISSKFEEITPSHCSSFFRKMLKYIIRCSRREEILE